MRFDDGMCNISYDNKVISITDCKANGPVLHMTGAGVINFKTNYIDINGIMKPKNIVNTLSSIIPGIRSDRGVIFKKYKIRGNISNVDDISID